MGKASEEILKKLPPNGFIRQVRENPPTITSQERVILIRKANDLFNSGDIEAAGKIFVHIRYGDGIIRLGDHYHQQNRFVDAMQMYHLAADQGRVDELAERMAKALRKWINS
ncbi:MAG: hypothetical protein ACRCVN_05380 [Spirochaetia bacterium]